MRFPGTVQQIFIDITDVRNCWSHALLNYDSDEFIKFTMTPLECVVGSHVQIFLEF